MFDSATPWTVAHQAPPSMRFSRQEYWSGVPLPSPGDLPNPGIEPTSLVPPALAGRFFTTAPPGKPKTGTITGELQIAPLLSLYFANGSKLNLYLNKLDRAISTLNELDRTM